MAVNGYKFTSLVGGATGALDAEDGTDLGEGDLALVMTGTIMYHYQLSATSGAAESVPDVIMPNTNAGDKRWILQRVPAEEVTFPEPTSDYFSRVKESPPTGGANTYATTRRTLVLPEYVVIINDELVTVNAVSLDLNLTSSWDVVTPATPANRIGKNFFFYGLSTGAVILSENATVPTGYDSTNSRKLGGFHCLCANVGSISAFPTDSSPTLHQYIAGDILTMSVWDLHFRPTCPDPSAMAYSPKSGIWVDIYPGSGVLAHTPPPTYDIANAYGGSVNTDEYFVFAYAYGKKGKRLLSDQEFFHAAFGSPDAQSKASTGTPFTTGGNSSTGGKRLISHIGCEDITGCAWTWLSDTTYTNQSSYAGSLSNVAISTDFSASGTVLSIVQGGGNGEAISKLQGGGQMGFAGSGATSRYSMYSKGVGIGRGCCDGINI